MKQLSESIFKIRRAVSLPDNRNRKRPIGVRFPSGVPLRNDLWMSGSRASAPALTAKVFLRSNAQPLRWVARLFWAQQFDGKGDFVVSELQTLRWFAFWFSSFLSFSITNSSISCSNFKISFYKAKQWASRDGFLNAHCFCNCVTFFSSAAYRFRSSSA